MSGLLGLSSGPSRMSVNAAGEGRNDCKTRSIHAKILSVIKLFILGNLTRWGSGLALGSLALVGMMTRLLWLNSLTQLIG